MIKLYTHFNDKDKKWFQVILKRVRQSKRQQSIEGKILDLCIAMEMLLLKDLTEKDPISFPFRFRGSWLLSGNDFSKRKKLYHSLKSLYGFRCSIAHNGVFMKQNDANEAHKKLPEFYNLAEQVIQLALTPSYPRKDDDWLKLILGGNLEP